MISKEVGAFSRGMPYNNAGTTRPEQSTVRVCVRIVAIILLETQRDYYAPQQVPRFLVAAVQPLTVYPTSPLVYI